MQDEVPNLELLLYIAKQILKPKYGNSISLETFPQMWGSTCGGFDVLPSGEPAIGGSAMTEIYTTVAHDRETDQYVVFFGKQPAYIVSEAPEVFFEDLKNRNMAPLSAVKSRY